MNQLRGFLLEHGVTVREGASTYGSSYLTFSVILLNVVLTVAELPFALRVRRTRPTPKDTVDIASNR